MANRVSSQTPFNPNFLHGNCEQLPPVTWASKYCSPFSPEPLSGPTAPRLRQAVHWNGLLPVSMTANWIIFALRLTMRSLNSL